MRTLSWWERLVNGWFGWRTFRLPAADVLPWERDEPRATANGRVDWPTAFTGLSITERGAGKVGPSGFGHGSPAQAAGGRSRTIFWGAVEHGERVAATIPLPARGQVWAQGWPNPMFDRRVIVGGSVEVVELSEWAPGTVNEARTVGKFRHGILVEGKTITAARLPLHRFLWSRTSKDRPHRLALVLPDYQQADGLLTVGPACGATLVLGKDTPSYRAMVALGGECEAVARALADHGAVIIDRSGYADVADNRTQVGKRPHEPSLHFHADGSWRSTNLGQLDVGLVDLRYAA